MGIFDWFGLKDTSKKIKLQHLANLFTVALSDGEVSDVEHQKINEIRKALGVSIQDYNDLVISVIDGSFAEKNIYMSSPKSDDEAWRYLQEISMLIVSDGYIDDREIHAFKIISESAGYPDNNLLNSLRAAQESFNTKDTKKLKKDLKKSYDSAKENKKHALKKKREKEEETLINRAEELVNKKRLEELEHYRKEAEAKMYKLKAEKKSKELAEKERLEELEHYRKEAEAKMYKLKAEKKSKELAEEERLDEDLDEKKGYDIEDMNKTIEQTYFQLSERLYGSKVIIKVTFNNNGNYHGNIYKYDHDDLYEKIIFHYRTLACWKNYREYTSSNNIPRLAMNTGLVKRIK